MATATAILGGGYVPPYAAAPSIVSSTTTTTTLGSSLPTATSIVNSQGGVERSSLLQYFTIPYIDAHTLSVPTWRYVYMLWILLAFSILFSSLVLRFSKGSGVVGCWWRKMMMRRLTIGGGKSSEGTRGASGKRKKGWASPTYGTTLTVGWLIGLCLAVGLIGADYIKPTTCTFGGECRYNQGSGAAPPQSTYVPNKRSEIYLDLQAVSRNSDRAFENRGGLNPNGWAPFNDPLLAGSNDNIQFTIWTSAARFGLVCYGMLPLVVALALKQWPFNFFAIPFLMNYHFDKTAILHRWSGRIIWAFSTAHTGMWTYQLIVDKDPFGRPVLWDAFSYYRFSAGVAGYIVLSLIVLLSFKPIRNRFYEAFYYSHILLVILLCVTCMLHAKPLQGWAIAALALWGAERMTRFISFMRINGIGGIRSGEISRNGGANESFQLLGSEKVDNQSDRRDQYPPKPIDIDLGPQSFSEKRNSYYSFGPGQDVRNLNQQSYPERSFEGNGLPGSASSNNLLYSQQEQRPTPLILPTSNLPPAGYAFAQLLPGKTIRLTINTPKRVNWFAGQHLFLTIPSVKLFQAHPYTITSVDENAVGIVPVGGNALPRTSGSEIVLLIRAQKGFSKALWRCVVKERMKAEREGKEQAELAKGVLLRSLVSSPLGSAASVNWGEFETLMIVCGGTGITYGITILEYACRRMARQATTLSKSYTRAGQIGADPKFKTTRIRFVWTMREFSHLSWVALTLQRCLEMSSPSNLQVDLFVSRAESVPQRRHRSPYADSWANKSTDFPRPTPPFASTSNFDSDVSDSEEPPIPRYKSQGEAEADYEGLDSVTDLVLFDGEEDEPTPVELDLGRQIRSEGKLRRARSRREYGHDQKKPKRPGFPRGESSSNSLPFSPPKPSFVSRNTGDSSSGVFRAADSYTGSSFGDSRSIFGQSTATNDQASEVYSLAGTSTRGLLPKREVVSEEEVYVDMTNDDREALDRVSELAKAGYPNLDRILEEEITRTRVDGRVIVACCGPSALNTQVRNLVSTKIDVGRVWKGEQRRDVSLVCEDFSF